MSNYSLEKRPVAQNRTAAAVDVGQDLRRHFEAVASEMRIPGIAYAVVSRGELIGAGGVGVGDAATDSAFDVHTQSRICSLTKSFTAAAVLMLRDAGEVELERPVSSYVPEVASWVLPTDDSPPLTVSMLMSMTGGLPEDDAWADRRLDWSADQASELLRRGISFATPPDTGFEYSNLGWMLLGRIISAAAGISAQQFIHREILIPLGLKETSWVPEGRIARGHRLRNGSIQPEDEPLGDGEFAPMGGLWSTASDLCRWIGFLLDAYPSRSEQDTGPLRRSSRRSMQQVHTIMLPDAPPGKRDLVRGYGWGLLVEHDERLGLIVGHAGGLPGYGCDMRWLPRRNIGIAALGNLTYAPLEAATKQALILLDELCLVPRPNAVGRVENVSLIGNRFAALIERWDDRAAADVLSENVFLDASHGKVVDDLAGLRQDIGTIRSVSLEPGSATRGVMIIDGERATARILLLLTPERPPRIQRYRIVKVRAEC